MSCVVDLSSRRTVPPPVEFLSHPAGVTLPFDDSSYSDFLVPEIRGAVCCGAYCADTIGHLPDVVRDGDRALVIGAGLGVVSTLIARRPRVNRVIAVEADAALVPYLRRVHELNGVPWVETINAVLDNGRSGEAPVFGARDRDKSQHRPQGPQMAMVPRMDLNLILAEERISLIVCDLTDGIRRLLAEASLGKVARILVRADGGIPAGGSGMPPTEGGLLAVLADGGFDMESRGPALLFDRAGHSAPGGVSMRGMVAGETRFAERIPISDTPKAS